MKTQTDILKEIVKMQDLIIKRYKEMLYTVFDYSIQNGSYSEKLESELSSLKQQLDKAEPTKDYSIKCDSCGEYMQPKEKVTYLCMNPYCENYIKIKAEETG